MLEPAQLEAVRMLTNHDLDAACPLACLLIGQPTLRRRIKLGILAALDQRIAVRYTMPGMTSEETASYITHHLTLAGRSGPLFSDDATALMVLPTLVVGNELLILGVVVLAVGGWFLAHRHGQLRGMVAASTGNAGAGTGEQKS